MYKNNFIDSIKIFCKSGDGGKGLIHFRKRKFLISGPDGGNGGNGGDILIKGNKNLNTFINLRYKKKYIANNGSLGGVNKLTGITGKEKIIDVPLGTIVTNSINNTKIEILYNNQKKVLFKGGIGGKGNFQIKNKYKYLYNDKIKGIEGWIRLELKILSDIGIIGFPNSGKSTLLSIITSAKPKIGNYPFTTLIPNIGVMYYKKKFTIADIPGIVKNSHEGKGLGYNFFKHIERNKLLLILVSSESYNPKEEYEILLHEIYKFNAELLNKKRLLAISKIDLINSSLIKEINKKISKHYPYIFISSFSMYGINNMKEKLFRLLSFY